MQRNSSRFHRKLACENYTSMYGLLYNKILKEKKKGMKNTSLRGCIECRPISKQKDGKIEFAQDKRNRIKLI